MGFKEEIFRRVQQAKDLPTLPTVFTQINKVMSNKNSSAADIARIIKDDPALTTKILRVTNSAAYGGEIKISSVTQAVSRIGFQATGDIAMSLSVLNMFKGQGAVDYKMFWRHSLSVAMAMDIIPKNIGKLARSPKDMFTSGLLHDVGVFVLDQHGGDLYRQVLTMVGDMGKPLHEVERQLMGTDHAEVGAMLLKKWNVPEVIIDAVEHHHDKSDPDPRWLTVAEIIGISNFICNDQGLSNGAVPGCVQSDESIWLDYGFTAESISVVTGEVNKQIEKSAVMMAAGKE